MANRTRKEKTDRSQYEGKEFLTYQEAMDYLGMRRSTLYNYILSLDIDTKKFKRDSKRYLAIADVKRIAQVREQPWLAGEDKGDDAA